VKELATRLHNRDLNAVPPFDRRNPSAENVALWVADELRGAGLLGEGVRLEEVTVWEGPRNSVTYSREPARRCDVRGPGAREAKPPASLGDVPALVRVTPSRRATASRARSRRSPAADPEEAGAERGRPDLRFRTKDSERTRLAAGTGSTGGSASAGGCPRAPRSLVRPGRDPARLSDRREPAARESRAMELPRRVVREPVALAIREKAQTCRKAHGRSPRDGGQNVVSRRDGDIVADHRIRCSHVPRRCARLSARRKDVGADRGAARARRDLPCRRARPSRPRGLDASCRPDPRDVALRGRPRRGPPALVPAAEPFVLCGLSMAATFSSSF